MAHNVAHALRRLDFPALTRVHPRAFAAVCPMAEVAEKMTAKASLGAEAATDASLVARCRAGEPAAFRALYGQYKRQVVSQLAFLVPRGDLEDVLQDVFVEVFRSIRRFEGRSAFSTWLYRLVVHVAMKARRRGGKAPAQLMAELPDPPDPASGPAEAALTRERMNRAESLLAELSPKKRAVLVLHDLRGMDAARIAELTGSNIMTVPTRLFYARREFEALAAKDSALGDFFRPQGTGS